MKHTMPLFFLILAGLCMIAGGLESLFTHAPVDRSLEQSLILLAIAFGILAREEKS